MKAMLFIIRAARIMMMENLWLERIPSLVEVLNMGRSIIPWTVRNHCLNVLEMLKNLNWKASQICGEGNTVADKLAIDRCSLTVLLLGNLSSIGLKTFFYPCGTFSRIATVATNRHMSPGEACNELMAYSLILACCCYTCCIRRKLRKMLNITGGVCDDFLSHLLCCCCALVQEWREVEARGVYGGSGKTKTSPPPVQYMES